MSLDVHLISSGQYALGTEAKIFVREDGGNREMTREEWDAMFPGKEPIVVVMEDGDEVYWANITHNLGKMAQEAGIYQCMWRPEELNITLASQLIEPLQAGLEKLKTDPEHYKKLNPPNGWGNYEILVAFVQDYLQACQTFPTALVHANR